MMVGTVVTATVVANVIAIAAGWRTVMAMPTFINKTATKDVRGHRDAYHVDFLSRKTSNGSNRNRSKKYTGDMDLAVDRTKATTNPRGIHR